ncbi:MAG TPA: enoyl-CoA hydratase/isomerase family protein [Ramlibacter sp.]|jgi:enoyl-CoA hydratase|uniref:enoyl-CoA hydratase/isomerase family protein n=1 Tax=Ramlibacter sp. TaxID=1917967 RepID=UPI002D756FCB|nr:enoyl-CoA hydratase/isomerase family protein [Ramlibacter sp.]HZY18606.1 enoyl-CoA hydratase/isomerase family protein [Ramlibacter sp.]
MSEVVAEVVGRAGRITLNRPKALNALSLGMIRELTAALLAWRDDPRVEVVCLRGQGREGPFGAFCAGGDIRFFHQAVFAGDPQLEDFFTEEYTLNHLVHRYPKPTVSFMDGVVMGGGMGISQGTRCRVVTERTKMAMPETNIGLFPDVGGGYFLSRCPGRIGEYLALTGEMVGAAEALEAGLADVHLPSADLPALWERLAERGAAALPTRQEAMPSRLAAARADIDAVFSLAGVRQMVQALESRDSEWAAHTAAALRKRSPLMLHVTLEQVRRARNLGLADDLRMERDLVRNCFRLRPGAASETVEGIRALAVDKDHAPRWNPASIEEVTPELVEPYFRSPWPAHAHPLRLLD